MPVSLIGASKFEGDNLRRNNRHLNWVLVVALSAFSLHTLGKNVCLADDEPRRGLLADGRAFRTDENGNQLVDYIAELEVSVEALERRVYGLEDELKEKQAHIDRLNQDSSVLESPQIKESSAASLVSSSNTSLECPKAACPTSECPAVDCPNCEDRTTEIITLNSKIDSANSEVADLRSELNQVQRLREADKQQYKNELTRVRHAMQESEDRSEPQRIVALNKQVDECRGQLDRETELRTSLESRHAAILERKESELEAIRDQLTELQVVQAKAQMRQSPQNVVPARVEAPAPVISAPTRIQDLPPQVSPLIGARERAVMELRSQVASGLTRLKMAIQTRDELFLKFDQRGRALQIKPSLLRTSSGATLESINREVNTAQAVRDLVRLRDEIREIDNRVSDDIATVRRLSTSAR
jgi:hypothetical protein